MEKSLREALQAAGIDQADTIDVNEPLLTSGTIDSVALFSLSLWVEEQLGAPVDPTSFDLLEQWDSLASILAFVHARAAGAAAVPAPADASAPPVPPVTAPAAPAPAVTAPVTAPVIVPPPAHPEYEIVRYTEAYAQEVARLQVQLWSPDLARNLEVFRWKYLRNPFAGEILVYLALHHGKAVAMRGFCGTLWESAPGAEPVFVYSADDLVIDPAHQNKGLFALFGQHAMADLASRGHAGFLSLSALRVTRLMSLTNGARSIGTMMPVGRLSGGASLHDRIDRLLQRLPVVWRLAGRTIAAHCAQASFAKLDAAQPVRDGGLEIRIAKAPLADAMAGLVARLAHGPRLRHLRDARFFGWRFASPLHEYRFVFAHEGGELAGYLILQRGLSEYANRRRVNIVDFEARSVGVARALLARAIEAGHFAELVTWSATLEPERLAMLRAAGFEDIDQENSARGLPCVLIRPVDAVLQGRHWSIGALDPADLKHWDLRMAYTNIA